MKLEHADLRNPRGKQHVCRVARQPAASDPVLENIDRVGNRLEQAGRLVALIAIGKDRVRILPRLLLDIAKNAIVCLGRRLLAFVFSLADDTNVQVNGDYDICPQRMTDTYGNGIDQATVDKPALFDVDRREQPGHRHGSPHGIRESTLRKPDLAPRIQIGGYGGERLRQVLNTLIFSVDKTVQKPVQSIRIDETGLRKLDVEKLQYVAACRAENPVFQSPHVAGHVGAADNSANGSTADDMRFDSFRQQRSYHTDMRPAARRPRSQGEADLW